MTTKSFLAFTVLVFVLVLVLAFLGIVFLLPGYLSLTDVPYRNATARVIRVFQEENTDTEFDGATSSTTITPATP